MVLVQLKPEHFNYFDKNSIKYSIARGNNEQFIKRLKEVFIPYYEDSLQRNYEKIYIINENETLESVLIKNDIELKRG